MMPKSVKRFLDNVMLPVKGQAALIQSTIPVLGARWRDPALMNIALRGLQAAE